MGADDRQLGRVRRFVEEADVVLEVRDARLPLSSSVTRMVPSIERKRCAVVLTRADLADVVQTRLWIERLGGGGAPVMAVDLKNVSSASKRLGSLVRKLAGRRARSGGLARFVVVGLPNVGKSTLINVLVGRKKAGAGDTPGVTRGKQWVRLSSSSLLMDTPGVVSLFDKLKRRLGGDFFKLAACNLVPPSQYDECDVAEDLLAWLEARDAAPAGGATLEELALSWGLLRSGGEPDLAAAAVRLLRMFHEGKLGRFTLDPVFRGEESQPFFEIMSAPVQLRIDETALASFGEHLRGELSLPPLSFCTVEFCDDAAIVERNLQVFGRDYPTDVISIPCGMPCLGEEAPALLGELFVGVETVAANAASLGIDFQRELLFVLAHGVLHLLGWEDESEPHRERMFRMQERLVEGWSTSSSASTFAWWADEGEDGGE